MGAASSLDGTRCWLLLHEVLDCDLSGAVSGQETLRFRLERSGAQHCRSRKFAAGHIEYPRAGGFNICA